MRNWQSAAILAVILALGLAVWIFARRVAGVIGDSLDETIEAEFSEMEAELTEEAINTALRVGFGRDADFEVAPGTPGYFASLDTVGSQFHYYAEWNDRTIVAADVDIAGEVMRLPVAEYVGRPTREVGSDQLRPVVSQFGFVVVRVVDKEGEQRRSTRVTIENAGDSPHRRGTQSPATGVARFFVEPGTYAVGAEDAKGEVTVGTQETVVCTLNPTGLTVDERRSLPHAGREPR
jgi:hypothetical protein